MKISPDALPAGYILGLERTSPTPRVAHLYAGTFADPGLPMCPRGWNRDEGGGYSIWRGHLGTQGVCARCLRRAQRGLPGVPARNEQVEEDLLSSGNTLLDAEDILVAIGPAEGPLYLFSEDTVNGWARTEEERLAGDILQPIPPDPDL